jgi:aspartyl-tRNA(Asn)/glutamyl-tRNA(Gln) amidotransferase subunit A
MQAQQFLASLPSDGSASLAGLRIGIPLESFPSPLTPASLAPFRALLTSLRARGATLHSVSTPLAPHALSAYYVIACAEASSNLARFDGVKWGMRGAGGSGTFKNVAESTRALFGEEVRKRILVGAYSLSAE